MKYGVPQSHLKLALSLCEFRVPFWNMLTKEVQCLWPSYPPPPTLPPLGSTQSVETAALHVLLQRTQHPAVPGNLEPHASAKRAETELGLNQDDGWEKGHLEAFWQTGYKCGTMHGGSWLLKHFTQEQWLNSMGRKFSQSCMHHQGWGITHYM